MVIGFYSMLSLGYALHMDGNLSSPARWMAGGWFGKCYLSLMFLAPILNMAVDALVERKLAMKAWMVLALGFTLAWVPHLSQYSVVSSGEGVGLLVFVYLTTRFVAESQKTVPCRILTIGIPVVFLAGVFVSGIPDVVYRCVRGWNFDLGAFFHFTNYAAPHVWAIAIMIVILFVRHVRLPSFVCRIAAFLGPSMFGVYLLHDTTIFGSEMYRGPQRWLMTAYGAEWHPIAVIVISACFAFAVSIVVDLLRRAVFCCGKGLYGICFRSVFYGRDCPNNLTDK